MSKTKSKPENAPQEKASADCPRTPCSESLDTEHRDYITCPKCGDHDPESEKFTKLAETKETGKCSTCGQVFHVIRHVTITYSTICIPNAESIHPESKPQDVEEPRDEGFDETACSRSCIVRGCQNRTDQGMFVGNLCKPCHDYLASGKIGPTTSFLGGLTRELNVARKALREIVEITDRYSDSTLRAGVIKKVADADLSSENA